MLSRFGPSGYNRGVNARLVRRFLWLAAFACLWLPVLDDPPLRTGAYLQDVTTEAATVAMITAQPTQLACTVRDGAGNQVAAVEGPRERRRHALRITGLRPGADYTYTVAEAGRQVDEGRLRTAPADDNAKVRFAFLGDSGGQPWWVWLQTSPALHWPARWRWFADAPTVTSVGKAVAAYEPHFLLHLGDVVYPWGQHAHYATGFFGPFAATIRNAPAYAVLGNHDVMDAGGLQALANFRLPQGPTTGDGRCYSFAWGPVCVIVLDCDKDHGAGIFEPGHPSYEFLRHELPLRSEPWIVVASHFPIRSASRQGNTRPDLWLSMLPLLQDHQVTLYLSGHDHCYQRFGPAADGSGVPLIVSGGGGKSLYEVRPEAAAAVLQSQYHWCSAEASGRKLLVRAHGLDGGFLDTLVIEPPAGERLDRVRKKNPARAARIDALE